MLTRFSVTNYRKFTGTVTLDLGSPRDYSFNTSYVRDGIIANALVIGDNASGKTNLIRAISDVRSNYYHPDLFSTRLTPDSTFINADAEKPEASFEYVFAIDGHSVVYAYTKNSDRRLTRETLTIDDEVGFDYYNSVDKMCESNLSLIGAEHLNMEFSGDYSSMLSYLSSNVSLDRRSVIPSLRRLTNQIVPVIHEGTSAATRTKNILSEAIRTNRVGDLQGFLERFGIWEKLDVVEDADGSKAVYCVHKRLVPFVECMSSGTRSLLSIFAAYEMNPQGSIFLLDEFDAYCHFEVAEKLVRCFGSVAGCQTISTTHNTSLTKNNVMRPDCIFKFGSDGSIKALSERTSRELRLGNNVERLLRNGEFS